MFNGHVLTISILRPDFAPGPIPNTGGRSVNETGSSDCFMFTGVGNPIKSKIENFRDLACQHDSL